MTERAKAAYLEWLARQITPNRRRNYTELLRLMQAKEFVYVHAYDENRVQDVSDLRRTYFDETGVKSWVDTDVLGPVSVLEVMIVLSKKMEFMTNVDAGRWAFQLLKNLELDRYSGKLGRAWRETADDILERLLWRQYKPSGVGGFFPLMNPSRDQREVELWYQMSEYLNEDESWEV